MRILKKLSMFLFVIALAAGCAGKKPQPEPAYERDSAAFRESITGFAAENDKTDNKITKADVIAKFGKFDKETKTNVNGKETPVSVYYSQSEEYKGGYTGKKNYDYFYVFVFEKNQLSRIFMRRLNYSFYKDDKIVKIQDRTSGPVEFGIEFKENPKFISASDQSLMRIDSK